MLRTFETDEELYQKFKAKCAREGKKVGDKLNELIKNEVKVHGEGNPIHEITKWADPDFKSFPAFKERLTTNWIPYLQKCNEKELQEVAEQSEGILNAAIRIKRSL